MRGGRSGVVAAPAWHGVERRQTGPNALYCSFDRTADDHGSKTILPNTFAVDHGREARTGLGEWQDPVDNRAGTGGDQHGDQGREVLPAAHGGADHAQRLEEDLGQFGPGRLGSGGGAADHQGPTGSQCVDRVGPGGCPDRLHHRIHPLRQSSTGRESCVRAELYRPLGPGRITRRHPDPKTGLPCQDHQRGGDPAPGALDQHRLSWFQSGRPKQHPVGRQPRGRQAGRLDKGQLGRLVDQVALRHPYRGRPMRRDSAPTATTVPGRASDPTRRSADR